jgi:hypothetical protein
MTFRELVARMLSQDPHDSPYLRRLHAAFNIVSMLLVACVPVAPLLIPWLGHGFVVLLVVLAVALAFLVPSLVEQTLREYAPKPRDDAE